mmetsp:Transcript_53016/g.85845  ORF Transcript_53016/g.85845 Transcript_53016/m.85845 type:complete len:327 (-) Transcript_53016:1037-2017(-)
MLGIGTRSGGGGVGTLNGTTLRIAAISPIADHVVCLGFWFVVFSLANSLKVLSAWWLLAGGGAPVGRFSAIDDRPEVALKPPKVRELRVREREAAEVLSSSKLPMTGPSGPPGKLSARPKYIGLGSFGSFLCSQTAFAAAFATAFAAAFPMAFVPALTDAYAIAVLCTFMADSMSASLVPSGDVICFSCAAFTSAPFSLVSFFFSLFSFFCCFCCFCCFSFSCFSCFSCLSFSRASAKAGKALRVKTLGTTRAARARATDCIFSWSCCSCSEPRMQLRFRERRKGSSMCILGATRPDNSKKSGSLRKARRPRRTETTSWPHWKSAT